MPSVRWGRIYITHAAQREEHGVKRVSRRDPRRAAALAQMRVEVSEYDQYLTGDVWTVEIEDQDGEVIDSPGSIYGQCHKALLWLAMV